MNFIMGMNERNNCAKNLLKADEGGCRLGGPPGSATEISMSDTPIIIYLLTMKFRKCEVELTNRIVRASMSSAIGCQEIVTN
jgi:hypothetical protein